MSNILTNQIRTSPGPSEIEKELIKRMEGQNFQNASGMIPRDNTNHRLNSENLIQYENHKKIIKKIIAKTFNKSLSIKNEPKSTVEINSRNSPERKKFR